MAYTISTNKKDLDIDFIHAYLCHTAYWALGRSKSDVITSIENCWCIGVFDENKKQVGFARVATDYVVFAWIMDVFVTEACRGKGVGKMIVEYIVNHPLMAKVNGIGLRTKDAHGLYEQFDFKKIENPETWMLRKKE